MKVEVLVATMHQTDYSLLKKMNIQTDAIIVNQCDNTGYFEFEYKGSHIIWVNTCQRGLSKSRNMALSYASGDICLLADDDIIYVDDYKESVLNAFRDSPNADVIAFNTCTINTPQKSNRKAIARNKKSKKNKYYGSVRLAFRLIKIQKYALRFNELLGAGAKYGSGEESLILREARKRGLRVYENKAYIAKVDYSTSTWFKGYDEEYYFNKGVFLAAAYGKMAFFYKWYFILQSRKISKLSVSVVNNSIKKGMQEYKNL